MEVSIPQLGPKILIVEDEESVASLMKMLLNRQSLSAEIVSSVSAAQQAINQMQWDLILLDWMLPGVSGIEFLKTLRSQKFQKPILMVTAKVDPASLVLALESGADDFISKPFDNQVFIARVRAHLRRFQVHQETGAAKPTSKMELGDLVLDKNSHQGFLQGKEVHLTPSEFKILWILGERLGCVMTREDLVRQVQGEGISVVGRTIDTHVFGLRKKLADQADLIETIRGVGYRMRLL